MLFTILSVFVIPKCITSHLPGLTSLCHGSAQLSTDLFMSLSFNKSLAICYSNNFCLVSKLVNQPAYILIQVIEVQREHLSQHRSLQNTMSHIIPVRETPLSKPMFGPIWQSTLDPMYPNFLDQPTVWHFVSMIWTMS